MLPDQLPLHRVNRKEVSILPGVILYRYKHMHTHTVRFYLWFFVTLGLYTRTCFHGAVYDGHPFRSVYEDAPHSCSCLHNSQRHASTVASSAALLLINTQLFLSPTPSYKLLQTVALYEIHNISLAQKPL